MKDLSKMTLKELRAEAEGFGILGAETMKKEVLREILGGYRKVAGR